VEILVFVGLARRQTGESGIRHRVVPLGAIAGSGTRISKIVFSFRYYGGKFGRAAQPKLRLKEQVR
jgi:hypothetical protein